MSLLDESEAMLLLAYSASSLYYGTTFRKMNPNTTGDWRERKSNVCFESIETKKYPSFSFYVFGSINKGFGWNYF